MQDLPLSPDDAVAMAVIDRATTMVLNSNDTLAAVTLVGLAQAMTDEQLEQTQDALSSKANEFDGLPFTFLKMAQFLITHRKAERFDAMMEAEIAIFGEPPEWDEVPGDD